MNLPIKQHIVPQTYLRQFKTTSPKKQEKIWVCQKESKHIREQRIAKTPVINDFYTFIDEENAGEKHYDAELLFGKDIEPLFRKSVEPLENNNMLSDYQKREFSIFVSSQKLRTVSMKEKISTEIEQAFKYGVSGEWFDSNALSIFKQEFLEGDKYITYEEFIEKSEGNFEEVSTEVNKNCFILFIPWKLIDFANEIASQNWSYLVAPKNNYFLTSDNPVILEREINDPYFPIQGGVFPLTPKLALNINSNEEKFKKIGGKHMRKINEQIIFHSDRFVYSHDEEFLKRIIRKVTS
ncbi:DUF4238 domain-containing protein [Halobacillus litoralis]|uniref:DUF4238 domain-containing protein n=1 Tax=Halobacillus litoralis TaxID=45668 RepID=A0A845FD62_9BACI|nr:DUF4238 domain-containing protein [Halobacillus litoralis]MYL71576.1 DUF4238 domain-containing protein [Halobacillus litoralis]